MLSCVVKFIVLTSPFIRCCLYLLASSQGSEKVEKRCHGVLQWAIPPAPLTGQSMCLISQRHALGKQALHQRSADTLIHLTSSHNSRSTLPDPGQHTCTYSRHDREIKSNQMNFIHSFHHIASVGFTYMYSKENTFDKVKGKILSRKRRNVCCWKIDTLFQALLCSDSRTG